MTLVATLAAVAAAGRVLLAAVPGVQPVTVIAVAAGVRSGREPASRRSARRPHLQPLPGAGAVDALADAGLGGLRPRRCSLAALIRHPFAFAAACFVLGFAFSSLMDLWLWLSFFPHTWEALTVVYARGVWFSAAHAIGNVVIALAVGPELRRLLERYGRRLRTEVVWA